jgi:hypothetical protein
MVQNQICILKGRFKALTTNTFGIFVIFIDKTLKSINKMSVIASHFSSMYENDPEQDWNKFEGIITQLRYNGEISVNLSNDFQSLFTSSFLTDILEIFIEGFDTKNHSKSEHVIISLVEKILSDKNIFLQLEKQTITKEEMDRVHNEIETSSEELVEPDEVQTEQAAKQMFNIEEGSILLNIDLIIGPINGIPIYELRPGDQIVVKIAGRTQKEQYFIDLLNAKNDKGEVLPVRAIVKEINADRQSKSYNLLVEIGPGIYGKASELEKVKLKRYDPVLDTRLQKKDGTTRIPVRQVPYVATKSSALFLWLIGGVALALTVLFLVFLRVL